MGGPDEGAFVLVEEILAQQKLDVPKLFHPDGFGQLAEGAVEVGVGELGFVWAQVGGGECFFDDGEGVEGDRHVHIGVGGVEGGPDVAVGEDAHVREVGFLVAELEGGGHRKQHFVVGVGAQPAGVHHHADDVRVDESQLLEDGQHVALQVRGELLFLPAVESEVQVAHIASGHAHIGPYQFLLKFSLQPLEPVHLRGLDGRAGGKVLHFAEQNRPGLFHIAGLPNPHHIAQNAVAKPTAHPLRVFLGHIVKIMVHVLVVFEQVSSCEEVGVTHHLDASVV